MRSQRCAALKLLCGLVLVWTVTTALAQPGPADTRRSGLDDMRPATQLLQKDDAQNPAMLWVAEGETLWRQPPATGRASCASCHGDHPRERMVGVAARYPQFRPRSGQVLTLAQQINACRQHHQQQPPWANEHRALLSLESHLALASRGLPIRPPAGDEALAAAAAQGQQIYQQRLGQLHLSCAQCHDQRAGQRLGASLIPQGHPTGYPIYRLEWQALGSLQRRLRGCLTGVRAQAWPPEAPEWTALEAYLKQRAAGMPLETPAVRP